MPSGATKLRGRSLKLDDGNVYLVNPGSVGQPRDGDPRAAFALFDPQAGTVSLERVEYCVDTTIRAAVRAGLPPEVGERLRTGT